MESEQNLSKTENSKESKTKNNNNMASYVSQQSEMNPSSPEILSNNQAIRDELQLKDNFSTLFFTKASGDCNRAINWINHLDPKVVDLIYWKDWKLTGAVLLSSFVFLLSLALFSVLSVVAYLLLVVLTITLTFRLYRNVLAAVQKSGEGNPFKKYLDLEIGLSEENVHRVTESVVKNGTAIITEMRRLILIEDIVDSIKFGLFLWVLTYIGAWFNGMTLIIIADVAIFTLPKFYDVYKHEINKYLDLVKNKIKEVYKLISEKIKLPSKKKVQ